MQMTIIVPTDFSSNAYYAAVYACEIAQAKNYELLLLHSYTTSSVLEAETNQSDDVSLSADLKIQELKSLLYQKFPSLSIGTECSRSLIVEKLSSLSQDNNFAMIIMGASGASQWNSIYYGSTTLAVIAKSNIPVLVVPNEPSKLSQDQVVLLTNFKPEELDTLKAYTKLLGQVQSLTLIHVFKSGQKKQNVDDTLNSWAYNIREMENIQEVQSISEQIHAEDENLDSVPEVLNNSFQQLNPNMILVTPSRKTFFERLFRSSVSKALALDLTKPAFFDKV